MPLYEYECQSCHERLEKIQSFSAAPLTVCPKCGGVLERVITAPAVQFKGSGWYVSDYGGKKTSGAAKSDSGSGEGKASESKSEAKVEAKPSTASSDTK